MLRVGRGAEKQEQKERLHVLTCWWAGEAALAGDEAADDEDKGGRNREPQLHLCARGALG